MLESLNTPTPTKSSGDRILNIVTLTVNVLGPAVVLSAGWNSLSTLWQVGILVLLAVLLIIEIVVPVGRYSKQQLVSRRLSRQHKTILSELVQHLREASVFYSSSTAFSIIDYANSVSNACSKDPALHARTQAIAARLYILGDWYITLTSMALGIPKGTAGVPPMINSIASFYQDSSRAIRDLARIFPPDSNASWIDDDRMRRTRERYNTHVASVERLIEQSWAITGRLGTPAFDRF